VPRITAELINIAPDHEQPTLEVSRDGHEQVYLRDGDTLFVVGGEEMTFACGAWHGEQNVTSGGTVRGRATGYYSDTVLVSAGFDVQFLVVCVARVK
jgi:hypothetical protein